jgi:hypothetical protein
VAALITTSVATADTATPPYDPAGHYIGIYTASNLVPPKSKLGPDGIPEVEYPTIGYQKNPVTVEQYGLWAYGMTLYKPDDPSYRAVAVKMADWLIAHQGKDGSWRYAFPISFDGVSMKAGWASAMAQGQAMSLFERVYKLTGDETYKTAAIRALLPLKKTEAQGGLKICFLGNCALPWLEEYPSTPPSYVLNGFMYTMIGIYDLATIAPGSAAMHLYELCRKTLDVALPKYNVHNLSAYDLTFITVKSQKPQIPRQGYVWAHVNLLRALDSLQPDATYRRYADLWAKNVLRAPKD